MSAAKIKLKKGKEKSILRGHPWIFSGAVHLVSKELNEGDVVEVYDYSNTWLCLAIYDGGSLAFKIVSFHQKELDATFWVNTFQKAFDYRASSGLPNKSTNVYRLIHAESDGCPGLIADVYNNNLVIQFHGQALSKIKPEIVEALNSINKWTCIYEKPPSILRDKQKQEPKLWKGKLPEEITVTENGNKFLVDIKKGQKTGFFIDQRENRKQITAFTENKTVLNAFGYSGGFSVYAAKNAEKVITLDSSKEAIELADRNAALNKLNNHEGVCADVFEYLKSTPENHFDVIVIDPPAFAKSKRAQHTAIKAYTRLNNEAMKKLKLNGYLLTFSCSKVINRGLFEGAVAAAAIKSDCTFKIVKSLQQSADHPVLISFPESLYLKGMVLQKSETF